MTELVERYVHQVGRYLPPQKRAEIEAELSSQINDQLDDRFAGSPTKEDVASVLAEFGHPYRIAISYTTDQYLIGPEFYPYMMMVLRHVWVLVPTIVIFLNIFAALIASQPITVFSLLLETLGSTLQATLIFSAVVVLIFAVIQRISQKLDMTKEGFNPLDLPKVDDPGVVDRFGAASGLIIATFMVLVFGYFLHVGGLTLRFNLNDPGEVIPIPTVWLLLFMVTIVGQGIMQLWGIWQKSWGIGSWLLETVLEVFGAICLYFAVLEPVIQRIITDNPTLSSSVVVGSLPEIITALLAISTLAVRGAKLLTLWNYRNHSTAPLMAPSRK